MESSKSHLKQKKHNKIITTDVEIENKNINENKQNSDKPEQSKELCLYLGSYEGNVFSIKLNLKTKDLEMFKFKVSENSIKVITHQSQFIFASGIDEMIHIYDMKKKEEKGLFVTYSGSISNIFIVKNFLLACGDDPEIPIWRLSDFSLLHTLKGHKKSVMALAVHKSGKFCISSSKDNTLIVWNLMNGLKIIKYNLKNLISNKIIFLNDDKHAAIIFDFEVWIFNYMKNSESHEDWIEKKIKNNFKIFDAFVIDKKMLLVSNLGELAIYENFVPEEGVQEKKEEENGNNKSPNQEIKLVYKKLDKPEKSDKEELDIRIKTVNYCKAKKLGLLTVIYSTNEVYVYDLNKILNLETAEKASVENTNSELSSNMQVIKKFKSINLKTADRLTCIDTQISNN